MAVRSAVRARLRNGERVPVMDGGPVVRLRSATERPYDDAIAAARTCYSSRVVDLMALSASLS